MSRIKAHGGVRQRDPRIRDKAHLGRVARLPCLSCWIRKGVFTRPVQVAHIRCGYPEAEGWRPVGMAEKPSDIRTAPLCVRCHLDGPHAQHRTGERGWWEALGVYPPAFCAALVAAFAAGQSGEREIRRARDGAFRACASGPGEDS